MTSSKQDRNFATQWSWLKRKLNTPISTILISVVLRARETTARGASVVEALPNTAKSRHMVNYHRYTIKY
jgi:hypothetical protein